MKELFPTLLGNAPMREQVGRRVLDGRIAHAYVIQGPRGTGKRLFSRLLAASLSCERRDEESVPLPCRQCEACRKILSVGTPDLKIYSRKDAATIGIDTVRRLREDMYLSPTECERKVYIIEDADTMTAAAQNALLIVLEEPPPDVLILLLCKDTSLLLPTVRSRVQILRMECFSRDALNDFLSKEIAAIRLRDTDPAAYDALLTAANGAPGEALRLLQKSEQQAMLDSRKTVTDLLHALGARAHFSELLAATSKLPTKRNECIDELHLLLLAVRDMILYKRDPAAELCFFPTPAAAEEESNAFSLRRLFSIYDVVLSTVTSLSENANLHVALTAMSDALLTHRT